MSMNMRPMAGAPGGMFVGRVHRPFLGLAFGLGVFGGLVLAVLLPAIAALRGVDASWASYAQLHGHLQAVGFVGLFIVGVGYRMFPAFAGRAAPFPRLVAPSFWLLATGVVARAAGQPSGDTGWGAVLFAASAWLELAGLAIFAAHVLGLARGVSRDGASRDAMPPYWLFLRAGALWFVIQAALGAWWITALALDGGRVIPTERDAVLVFTQFFGVHLMFILGVGLRAFPTFFAAGPLPVSRVRTAFVLTQAGLVTVVAVGVARASGLDVAWVIENVGYVSLGAGLARATTFTGWWRAPSRIRPASRPSAYLLQPAMAWLTLAGVLLAGFAIARVVGGEGLQTAELDSVRHIVAVGVVLSTIVGMAQMILPEFAGERLLGRQAAWRGMAFGVALTIATVLRAGARPLAAWLPSAVVWWSMSVAGVLALGVVAALGWFFLRGVRSYGLVLEAAARPSAERGGPRG